MSDVVNEETGKEETGTEDAGNAAVAGNAAAGITATDNSAADSEEDSGALAAEFVLGTLDSDERIRANGLLDRDPHFRGMVRVWERRLGELHLMVEPVEPPVPVWESIKGKLESVERSPAVALPETARVSTEKTIASLEALEAQLREEGLATVPAAVADAAPMTTMPAATGEPDREPLPERQEAAFEADAPGRRWGFLATVMTLVAIALGGLIAAWRYFPDRLPPQLRAEQVLNIHAPAAPAPPARPVAPPGSQFDE